MQILAQKLKKGDEIRIVAPSSSMNQSFITKEVKEYATKNLEAMGFTITFGRYINEVDEFNSTTIAHRLDDFHDAFKDKNVKAIFTVIGGLNSNQLLQHLNYDLIRKNPKILCGYSDITALQNAIFSKTKLITYYGPHYFTFGVKHDLEYTRSYFKRCLMDSKPFDIVPGKNVIDWSDKDGLFGYKNSGIWVIQKGKATGRIIGGNLCTFNLLQGTRFMPDISGSVLFIEDDNGTTVRTFDRDLQSLLQQNGANKIKGLVIGRFQKESEISLEILKKVLSTKILSKKIPIIANVDFGHTYPMITYPIGGEIKLEVTRDKQIIRILRH